VGSAVEGECLAVDAREVEQVSHQHVHPAHRALDHLGLLGRAGLGREGAQQDLCRHPDRRERRPQIVTADGENVLAGALLALCRREQLLGLLEVLAFRVPRRFTQPRDGELRVDARDELVRREWLDDVCIGTAVETLYRRLLARARRQQHDRYRLGARISTEGAHEAEAVEAGHHHIGQDEVGWIRRGERERLRTVGRRLDRPVSGQQAREITAHVRIVVGDQDPSRVRPAGWTRDRRGRRHRRRDVAPLRDLCEERGGRDTRRDERAGDVDVVLRVRVTRRQ